MSRCFSRTAAVSSKPVSWPNRSVASMAMDWLSMPLIFAKKWISKCGPTRHKYLLIWEQVHCYAAAFASTAVDNPEHLAIYHTGFLQVLWSDER